MKGRQIAALLAASSMLISLTAAASAWDETEMEALEVPFTAALTDQGDAETEPAGSLGPYVYTDHLDGEEQLSAGDVSGSGLFTDIDTSSEDLMDGIDLEETESAITEEAEPEKETESFAAAAADESANEDSADKADDSFLEQYKDCPVLNIGEMRTIVVQSDRDTALLVKPETSGYYNIRTYDIDDEVDTFGQILDENGVMIDDDDDGSNYIDESTAYLLHVSLEAGKTYVLLSKQLGYGERSVQVKAEKTAEIKELFVSTERLPILLEGDVGVGNYYQDEEYEFLSDIGQYLDITARTDDGEMTIPYGTAGLDVEGIVDAKYGKENPLTVTMDGVSTTLAVPVAGVFSDYSGRVYPALELNQPKTINYNGKIESGIVEFSAPASGIYRLSSSSGKELFSYVVDPTDNEEAIGYLEKEDPIDRNFYLTQGQKALIITENEYPGQSADYTLTIKLVRTNENGSGYQTPGGGTEHTHSFGAWKRTKEPTVFAAGQDTRTCACGVSENRPVAKLVPFAQLNVSGTLPLKKGQKTSAVRVSYAAGDSVKSVVSSNPKNVTASADGDAITLKGDKTGASTVRVILASGVSASFKVKVQKKEVKAKKIQVNTAKITLKKGKTYSLAVTVVPITTKEKVKYQSSDKKIATVSGKGVIKAKKKGKAVITVKCGKKSKKIKVIVEG